MYIAVEGVIGVGKTTLARLLMDRFEAEVQLEVFEENPFLADFYSDRNRYAFQTQIFFLLSRYHQQRRSVNDMIESEKNLITDYTFAKDSLFAQINLEGDELEMYFKVHEALGEKVRLPDLIIYLTADIDVVMQRIATRDRSYERNMETAYIESLTKTYNDHYQFHYQGPPVLTIDTTDLNFIKHETDLDLIETQVRDAFKNMLQQSELPMNIDQNVGN
ncbi:MAG: deoxynucleoside kinase [Chloroflexi bacterium]|jgi:deoxyguanosine kinase|nr:deoxynucleoside kinase [Chloroflexota bacterium]MBT3670191.1 deoxynucleoside kinase [Chloroflexota bacterium]MBT4004061.1 deoxynucleoside kinase [Chloroflexota bacterium]MBT4306135.1 deoxynucleoside kinase [Chloroflexota bacterium]MBT4534515.1 deoxynucleoside kinase [Chloroflexota bacterium]